MGTGYFQVIKFDNGVTVNSLIGNEFDLFFNVGAFALVIAIAKP
jgi:hypothetical protein